MKKLLFFLLLVLATNSLFSQAKGINYKAIISDNGTLLQNQAIQVQFSILRDGTALEYQETHSTTTDDNGIIILNIGEGTAVSGLCNSIHWYASQFLKVEIDTGSGYVDFGTTEFKTVPYAIYAENGNGARRLGELSNVNSDITSLYLGNESGESETDRNLDNTAVGHFALDDNTDGFGNSVLGLAALGNNTSGNFNTAIGSTALLENLIGDNNTSLGYRAGNNSIGDNNIFIGYRAGYNETGSNKLYIENSNSATPLIGGDFSTDEIIINGTIAIVDGTQGLDKILTSDVNGKASWQTAATGATRLNDLTDAKTGGYSTFIGYGAGVNDDGSSNDNTGIGYEALHTNTTGYNNVANGVYALYRNTTGGENVANGNRSLRDNTTGSFNVAYGDRSLQNNTTGGSNTAYGYNSLQNNITGSNNTVIGYRSGYNAIGTGNVFLGNSSGYNETGDNKLYIENSDSATPLIGGDFSTDKVTISGTLDVSGNITANLTGDVIGNITGNVTGDVTGDVTGNLSGNVNGRITATHSGNSDMKAYIYGSLYATGAFKAGPSSDGFTSSKVTTGHYRITFDTNLGSEEAYMLIASASNTPSPQIITYHQSSGYFDVYVWGLSGNLVDSVFNFVVYKK